MAGVITTGNHPKLLWPGLHALFGTTYKDKPMQHEKVFEILTSSKAYEEEVELTGFGLAPVKPEADAISYDSHSQGWTKRYTNVTYAFGFIETEEAVEDNQYKGRATARTKLLARSMRHTKEIVCANVINRGFDSNYLGGDGKELFATDHTTLDGTQSNELASPADMSEAAIEDMVIQIMNATDSRGLRIQLMPEMLLISNQNWFEASRILKSELQNDTANNAVNAIKANGVFPRGAMAWSFLTDTDAWFIKTDAPEGLKVFNRRAVSFQKDSDFDTSNFKHKASERYSVGWTDWRSAYGSAGS